MHPGIASSSRLAGRENRLGRTHDLKLEDPLGRPLAHLTVRTRSPRNQVHQSRLDLRELLHDAGAPALTGATVVSVRDPQSYWSREAKLVVVTDLGLLVKRAPKETLVWVTSLSTTQAVADADVTVYSRTNQRVFEGKTGPDGFVRFAAPATGAAAGEDPFLVVAASGADLTYLPLSDGDLSDSGFDVGGQANLDQGYRAFAWPERGIYRPGETAHLSAVVREAGGATAGGFPVLFRVRKPDGSAFAELAATPSPQGIAHADVTVPEYAPTGVYTIAIVVPGHDDEIGATRIQVEDFLPNRMALTLEAPAGRLGPGAKVAIAARGAHLFGSPAVGRTVKAALVLADAPFAHADWPDFQFGDPTREFSSVRLPAGEIVLDDAGKGVFAVDLPAGLKPQSGLTLSVNATLLEVGGRGVTAWLSRPVDPAPYYATNRQILRAKRR